MTPFQIFAGFVMVFGVLRAFMLYRERKLNNSWFIFWLVIWGGVGVLAFVPSISYRISAPLGVESGINLVVYVSIIVLFYLVFRIFLRLEKLQTDITRLVREIALGKK